MHACWENWQYALTMLVPFRDTSNAQTSSWNSEFQKLVCALEALLQCSVPEGDLHCQCILPIFPASVHQFYVNVLVCVNINPFLYTKWPICTEKCRLVSLYYPPTCIDQFIIITVESLFKKDFGCPKKNRVFKQNAAPMTCFSCWLVAAHGLDKIKFFFEKRQPNFC